MAIISHALELVYCDVPKIACTSLKSLFWQLEHGRPLREPSGWLRRLPLDVLIRLGLADRSIHEMPGYQTRSHAATGPLPEGYETLVVLRDPIARLHSAWRDKVGPQVFARRGETEDVLNEGLPLDPDFGTFVDLLERYRDISRPARVHSNSYAWHLGPDLNAYDHVFRLEDGAALAEFLSSRAGKTLNIAHQNKAVGKTGRAALTPAQRERLIRATAQDYAWLQGLYDPAAGLATL